MEPISPVTPDSVTADIQGITPYTQMADPAVSAATKGIPAAASTAMTAMNPLLGGLVSGGLGLFGDILNLGVNLWTMNEQKKAQNTANAKAAFYYDKEHAENRTDTAFEQGRQKRSDERTAALDRLAAMNSWIAGQKPKFAV
jgi:hypothetical protein